MNSNDWHNVLIEWVNCLELSTKNVINIEDLKTFDFLNNLRKKLCSKQHQKQQQQQQDCDILTFIFKLFQRYYPKFIVKNSNEIHLLDLPRLDLIAILSLLLHYTCIHDRRDLFILPLCDKLTQTTQVIIKQFLEKLDDNSQHITMEILDRTIGECMEAIKIDNQLITTTTTATTPSVLQDLFKTPKFYRRYRFEQRDIYLNELLNELELERQEKLDMQQQLLTLEHLNVKLTKKLELKTKEILQLHEQHGTSIESTEEEEQQQQVTMNQKEKLYENEINFLNQYVKKLEDEQEQLEKLQSLNLKKLKQYEIDLIVWQDRYNNMENDFNKLSKENELLLNENKNLNLNIGQLQTLLDEYRIKGEQSTFECDSSILSMQQQQEQNYSFVQDSSDNSASVVIEVQLRDVKEENQKLKDRIQDLEDDGILLKNELDMVQRQLKEAQQNSQNKVLENQSLHQQLDSLKKEFNKIEIVKEKFDEKQQLLLDEFSKQSQYYRQSLKKIFNDFNKIKQDNGDLKIKFQQFYHEMSLLLSKMLINIKESEAVQLQNLEEKQIQTDDFHLKDSNDELIKQQQIEADFKREINDLKQQLQGKDNEMEKLELENCKLNKLRDEIEQKLFELTDDTTTTDSQNLIETFQRLQTKIMKGNIEQQSKIKTLNDTVQDYEITISGLKKVIDNNFDEFTMLKNNYNQLQYETDLIRNELDEIKIKRQQLPVSIMDLFKKNNLLISDGYNGDDLENYLYENINKLIQNQQELIVKNETIIDENNKFQHLFDKLNILLFEYNELNIIKEKNLDNYLQLIYDKIYEINNNLKSKLKPLTIQKENIQPKTIIDETLENEWKKKNMMLKQKLVLIENSKNNLEKKLKQVRDDNKCLIGQLQQLQQQQSNNNNNDDSKIIQQDLDNIRVAYGNLMSTNSKLELENLTLRKLIDERTNQLSDTMLIKENYEKLLEENCCLKTEIDTIKYKRLRDKDEYLRLLRKEREQINNQQQKSIQDVRNEYENKLQRMKEKMLKLYQEEVYKETQKFKQLDNNTLAKTVSDLRSELFEAEQKMHLLEMERDMLKSRRDGDCDYNFYLHEPEERRTTINNNSNNHENRLSIVPPITAITTKASTLPQTVVEETIMARRTCITNHNNIEMEDEEEQDLFNNKYLNDLKEGRCLNDITNNGRLSELAWRNSLLPPHLKSSYPAEIQYLSPNRFKEDDIKSGNLEFENSLVKLLPNHNNDNNNKPRKKDFGTTSYKKPGPPTPSKNGGRLSLQGNEIQQQQMGGTPKRSTPGRIKSLFTTNRNTMLKNDTSTPTKARRLSNLFKRPK